MKNKLNFSDAIYLQFILEDRLKDIEFIKDKKKESTKIKNIMEKLSFIHSNTWADEMIKDAIIQDMIKERINEKQNKNG
ncbi:MAG: hypothetical protein ACXADW_12770 [Candidatus Hodarchaeales archaeon]|jgi:hypothetical protein